MIIREKMRGVHPRLEFTKEMISDLKKKFASSEEYKDIESGKNYKCFPSRSVAAVCDDAVVLSVPASPTAYSKFSIVFTVIE